jgi:hypothetical protein
VAIRVSMDQTSASGWQGMMEGDGVIDEQFKELCEAAGVAPENISTDRQLPMSRRFAGQRNQPGLSAGSMVAFERFHAASVRCERARRGTSAWRVRTQ